MGLTTVHNQFLKLATSDSLTTEGDLKIDGTDLIYHDGVSEVTVSAGGGGGGGGLWTGAQKINGGRAMNATGVQLYNHTLGVVPQIVIACQDIGSNGSSRGTSNGVFVNTGSGIDGENVNSTHENNTNHSRNPAGQQYLIMVTAFGNAFWGSLQNLTTTTFEINWTLPGAALAAPTPVNFRMIVAG